MLKLEGKIELEVLDSEVDCLVNNYILDAINEWISEQTESCNFYFSSLSASSQKELWEKITKRVLDENQNYRGVF